MQYLILSIDVLSPDQCVWFRDYYCKLSAYSPGDGGKLSGSASSLTTVAADNQHELECRRLCAYNFPVSVGVCGCVCGLCCMLTCTCMWFVCVVCGLWVLHVVYMHVC